MIDNDKLLDLHTNQRLLVIEMQNRGIDVDIIYQDMELIEANYKGHREWILDRDSSITPYSVSIMCGDKYITKKILQRENISAPLGERFNDEDVEICSLYAKKIGYPVVVKPVFGSHGDNVYMNVQNKDELIGVISKIKNSIKNKDYIIEKQFEGKEYRIFLTKDGNYAVLYREPANVIGDGINTIGKLIDIENEKRKKRENCLCPICIDDIALSYMEKNNIKLEDIPKSEEKVYLRSNSNVAKGGYAIDYTDKVHKSAIDNCTKVLKTFSGLSYVGIDYMSKDIEVEQTEDMYNIIEINTVPGIGMHTRPSTGKAQNVAKYMVDMMFPETLINDTNSMEFQKLQTINNISFIGNIIYNFKKIFNKGDS